MKNLRKKISSSETDRQQYIQAKKKIMQTWRTLPPPKKKVNKFLLHSHMGVNKKNGSVNIRRRVGKTDEFVL